MTSLASQQEKALLPMWSDESHLFLAVTCLERGSHACEVKIPLVNASCTNNFLTCRIYPLFLGFFPLTVRVEEIDSWSIAFYEIMVLRNLQV